MDARVPEAGLDPELWSDMDASLALRRKRLLTRSRRRGTRELDLLLGEFAGAYLGRLTEEQLDRYEGLLLAEDPDIYDWIIGAALPPPTQDHDVFRLVREFVRRRL
jgi:antitoxin CptB